MNTDIITKLISSLCMQLRRDFGDVGIKNVCEVTYNMKWTRAKDGRLLFIMKYEDHKQY